MDILITKRITHEHDSSLQLRLSQELRKRVERAAHENDQTFSETIRQLLTQALDAYEQRKGRR